MEIITDKPLRIATLSGAAIAFEAGIPITVSEEIGLLALQQGARDCKSIIEPVVSAVPKNLSGQATLEEALAQLIEEGDPSNFKADGSPKAAVVNKLMSRTVTTDERAAAWEAVLNA